MGTRRPYRTIRDELILHGSTQALVRMGFGEDEAAAAMFELIQDAPVEVQSVPFLAIEWHRHQKAYNVAESIGDTRGMIAAAKAASDLVRTLH